MTIINFEKKSEPNRLRCTKCGATTDAPCDCGAPFELLQARERARIVVEQDSKKLDGVPGSDGLLAKLADVDTETIRRARKRLLPQNAAVATQKLQRKGLNDKLYSIPPPQPVKEWTPEEDTEIMRLHKEGKGDIEIANILGVSRGAASGRRGRLMTLRPDLESRLLPPIMPDDILQQVTLLASTVKARMFEIDSLSVYVDQMHEDTRQVIAEQIKVIHNLSRDIIKRLVGGVHNVRPPTCGTPINIRK
jgi:hypothetical protein